LVRMYCLSGCGIRSGGPEISPAFKCVLRSRHIRERALQAKPTSKSSLPCCSSLDTGILFRTSSVGWKSWCHGLGFRVQG
jgi:hypothetical protein